VSVATYPTKLHSTKVACFPAWFTRLRKEPFNSGDQFGSGHLKNVGEFKDCGERRAVFAALQQAYVLWVIATLEGERFLSEMTLLPQLIESPCKGSLLRRTLFVPKWHPQRGVCGVSMNSSTKYSIPYWIDGFYLGAARHLGGKAA